MPPELGMVIETTTGFEADITKGRAVWVAMDEVCNGSVYWVSNFVHEDRMKKFQFFSHVGTHMREMLTIVHFLCNLLLHETLLLSNVFERKGFPRNGKQNVYLSAIDGYLPARADGMVHRCT